MNKKIILIIIAGLVLVGLLFVVIKQSDQPKIGKTTLPEDKKIEQSTEVEKVEDANIQTETEIETEIQVVPDDIKIEVLPTDTTELNKQADINTMENLPETNAFKKAETNPFEEGYKNPFE